MVAIRFSSTPVRIFFLVLVPATLLFGLILYDTVQWTEDQRLPDIPSTKAAIHTKVNHYWTKVKDMSHSFIHDQSTLWPESDRNMAVAEEIADAAGVDAPVPAAPIVVEPFKPLGLPWSFKSATPAPPPPDSAPVPDPVPAAAAPATPPPEILAAEKAIEDEEATELALEKAEGGAPVPPVDTTAAAAAAAPAP